MRLRQEWQSLPCNLIQNYVIGFQGCWVLRKTTSVFLFFLFDKCQAPCQNIYDQTEGNEAFSFESLLCIWLGCFDQFSFLRFFLSSSPFSPNVLTVLSISLFPPLSLHYFSLPIYNTQDGSPHPRLIPPEMSNVQSEGRKGRRIATTRLTTHRASLRGRVNHSKDLFSVVRQYQH